MKTLIISDIHNRWRKAEAIISKEKPDKVIFLGDYFDDFNDGPYQARLTAQWLKHSLQMHNRVHIMGNHDLGYCTDNPTAKCSGYEIIKHDVIRTELSPEDWTKLKWFHFENGWLFTHAGLHPIHVPPLCKDVVQFLDGEVPAANRALHSANMRHWFWHVGFSRFGNDGVGGILWCDANFEFDIVPGVKQVFGHTPQQVTDTADLWRDENNLCLDTHSQHYGVMDEHGNIVVKKA